MAALPEAANQSAAWIERRRTCWAYSPGGHLSELQRATAGIHFVDCFHVTFASGRQIDTGDCAVHELCHPRRNHWRLLHTAWQTWRLFRRERPQIVVSTGADVALPALVLGRLMGARVIFIETAGTIEPSLTGRLAYRFANLFIVQWPEKLEAFPKAVLSRGLLL